MLSWLLTIALAQEPPQGLIGLDDVIGVDTNETTVYVFPLSACDRFRAELPVIATPSGRIAEKVIVTLQNKTGSTCLFRGVILQGWMEGVYLSSQRLPEGAGLFVPPGGELSFRVKPYRPELPRGKVQLQLPPKSGAIVLIGVAPEPPPAEGFTPAP